MNNKNNKTNNINNEASTPYQATAKVTEDLNAMIINTLNAVVTELKSKALYPTLDAFITPELVKNYLTLSLALEEREHFHVLFLDNQHRLLLDARLFSGTIDGAPVYPREVVKQALNCNANAVILAHNHPSGMYAKHCRQANYRQTKAKLGNDRHTSTRPRYRRPYGYLLFCRTWRDINS